MLLAWSCFVAAMEPAFADRVILDTGNTMEGVVKEEGDVVALQYVASEGGSYALKTIQIPRNRIKEIVRDDAYFKKFADTIRGLGGVGIAPTPVQERAADSIGDVVREGNEQVQENLDYGKALMKKAKYHWGWHEGYHYDPNNGWHHENHQGLYDPQNTNLTIRESH